MKKIYATLLVLTALISQAQIMSFTMSPDSAKQTPRGTATGTFSPVSLTGGSYSNNSTYYSICCSNSKSYNLYVYDFKFNIPLSATITGVAASYSITGGNGGPTNYKIDSLSLCKNFMTISNYKRDSVPGPGLTPLHGSSSDIWGATLSPSIVNSSDFGLRFMMDTYGINTTVLGGFKLIIYYMTASGVEEMSTVNVAVYAFDKKLYIKDENGQRSQLEIFNITGKKIMHVNLEGNKNSVDLSSFSTGIYFYTLSKEGKSKTGKFVVD
jgi:hypothetical protein